MLRDYQRQAVDSLFSYFANHAEGAPVISLPTGSGKSHVIASFIEESLAQWPAERFLIVSHNKEILSQNASKLDGAVGVYSAGLGRRETGHPVTVAGIQSVYKRADELGPISIVIVDECHLVSKTKESMYHQFLDELRELNPGVRVVGLTATPYRLDSGPLIKGDNRIFTALACNVSIKDLIAQGYLSPIESASTNYKADASNVAKRAGDYAVGDLERFMNHANITESAIIEAERVAADCKAWLVFCVGVDHARDVAQALRMRGHAAEIVVGDTPSDTRAQRIKDFKAGKIKALVSVGVLTTGFDAPNADALICLRPTLSPVLWVQMVGRITRTHDTKTRGMVVDFTANTHVHGPIDLIEVDGNGNVRTSPYRVCPECGKLIEPRAKGCDCGYSFERECHKCHALFDRELNCCPDCGTFVRSVERKPGHAGKASGGEVISTDAPVEDEVDWWSAKVHEKEGKPPSMRVTYYLDELMQRRREEWLCFEHGGYATTKARQRWMRLGGKDPVPQTTAEALARFKELRRPDTVKAKREGKYWRIL